MGCTKAMIVALLRKIRREIEDCEDIRCAASIINAYIAAFEEKTFREIEAEIFH